jgi:hypothetical protein
MYHKGGERKNIVKRNSFMLCRMQGEVYLDEDRAFMKALGDRWLGVQVS